jgi:heme-degrading monooxygenase HmoA
MPIYSIWESRFPAGDAEDGLAVTESIWHDMLDFDGYVSHELLVDDDDRDHLLVVSQWASRQHADDALRRYRGHANAEHADRLVSEPRRRFVATLASSNHAS